MIYILSGNDFKKKNAYLKKLYKGNLPIFVPPADISKEMLFDQAGSTSLFGGLSIFVFENALKEIDLKEDDISILNDSDNLFIFLEEKLLAVDLKKYKKHANIEDFSILATKQTPKMNVFNIAEAFSKKDKVNTWILYREAISLGVSPEEVSGILFWKIKTMLLNGARIFTPEELKKRSSELVALYHEAHRGEVDFTIGLEQFILNSLNK